MGYTIAATRKESSVMILRHRLIPYIHPPIHSFNHSFCVFGWSWGSNQQYPIVFRMHLTLSMQRNHIWPITKLCDYAYMAFWSGIFIVYHPVFKFQSRLVEVFVKILYQTGFNPGQRWKTTWKFSSFCRYNWWIATQNGIEFFYFVVVAVVVVPCYLCCFIARIWSVLWESESTRFGPFAWFPKIGHGFDGQARPIHVAIYRIRVWCFYPSCKYNSFTASWLSLFLSPFSFSFSTFPNLIGETKGGVRFITIIFFVPWALINLVNC